ncbi:MAG: DUF5518 domain-containing protein [Halobacteriales archaeon]
METEPSTPDDATDSTVGDPERSIWLNALVGGIVTVVTAFVPFSPVLGGGVAGYLQQGADRDGLRVGALAGLLAAVPLIAIVGLVVLVVGVGIAATGEVAGPVFVIGILLVVALFVVGYTVVLSAIGGLVGAALADRERAG